MPKPKTQPAYKQHTPSPQPTAGIVRFCKQSCTHQVGFSSSLRATSALQANTTSSNTSYTQQHQVTAWSKEITAAFPMAAHHHAVQKQAIHHTSMSLGSLLVGYKDDKLS